MVLISSRVLGHGLGFMGRALIPQAVVALATSSSMATLPATRVACDQLGANADEATPFYTIGATINMVGTLMGLTLITLYGMDSYGIDVTMADRFIVAFTVYGLRDISGGRAERLYRAHPRASDEPRRVGRFRGLYHRDYNYH